MCVCGGIFLVDGPMHLKASGFYQCSAGWGAANREDKISTLISSSRSDVCQGGKKMLSTFKEDGFCWFCSE